MDERTVGRRTVIESDISYNCSAHRKECPTYHHLLAITED